MNITNTLPIDCTVPEPLLRMLDEYVHIVNHLIALGLHVRAQRDGELRDLARPWFHKNYGGKLQVHYLDSASVFAMQNISSWRVRGGDITSLPRVRNPIAFLNNDMFSFECLGGDLFRLSVKMIPRQAPITMEVHVKHRRTGEWITGRLGSLVIVPSGMRLCFMLESPIRRTDGVVGMDTNFDSLDLIRDDGKVLKVDIAPIITIQASHKRKRESVHITMSHNPAKRDRLLVEQRGRERNRVKDALHKSLHGEGSDVPGFLRGRTLVMEDLRSLSPKKGKGGREFNAHLSSWARAAAQEILARRTPSKVVYARGTSSYCPFCGSKVSHPRWSASRCPDCGDFDRDLLAAVSILLRGVVRHRKGEPWALVKDVPPITITPTDVGTGTSPPQMVELFAPSVPSADQPQSDIDFGVIAKVMHENRSDAGDNESLNKTGHDAKSICQKLIVLTEQIVRKGTGAGTLVSAAKMRRGLTATDQAYECLREPINACGRCVEIWQDVRNARPAQADVAKLVYGGHQPQPRWTGGTGAFNS